MYRKTIITSIILISLILTSIPSNIVYQANDSMQRMDTNGTDSSFYESPSHNETISEMIEKVNSTKIHDYIQKLQSFETRYIGAEGNKEAAAWIKKKFQSFGLRSKFQNFTYENQKLSNVIATQEGVNPEKQRSTIVVGAHFDSISGGSYYNESSPAPGADDDASGVAVTLETARILSNYNFSRTIKYGAWNAEEVGLVGSSVFANYMSRRDDIKVDAMFQYDMVGYTPNGSHNIKVHANEDSAPQLDHMVEVNRLYPTNVNITANYNSSETASDHSSFWAFNQNATLAIEKIFNPYYHSINDTIDKISMSMVSSVTRLSIGTVSHLGELVDPDPFLFYLNNPEQDSLHHGGETVKIRWFVGHENISSSRIRVELNYTFSNETQRIGTYQGTYKTDWTFPEVNGNLTINCRVFSPDNVLLFEEDYGFTVDSVHPQIVNIEPSLEDSPVDSQVNNFTVDFSEDIDKETLSKDNIYFKPALDLYYFSIEDPTTIKINVDIGSIGGLEKNTSYSLIFRNVTDKAGNLLSGVKTFDFKTAKNKPPVADFNFSPKRPEVYESIDFTSTSNDQDGNIQRYNWDFGGFKSSDKKNPTIFFEKEGSFYVNLTVWDKEGASSSLNKTIEVVDPISARINIEPKKPYAADKINFTFGYEGNISLKNLRWNFGNGNTSDDREPVYRYTRPGQYNVTLKLDLKRGYTYVCERSIVVSNTPPEGNLSLKRTSSSSEIEFSLNCSDYEGEVTNVTWHFGDGSLGYGRKVTHDYSESGTYNVTVELTDEDGITSRYEKTVNIENDFQWKDRVFYLIIPGIGLAIVLLVLITNDKK